jgi:peroxiredoxin family protein
MSTEKNVTNLNQFRKAKARADRRALADENAVKYGRSKAQKALEQAQTAKAKALLDAHKKDDT